MNYQGTDIKLGIGSHFYRNAEAAHYHRFNDNLALSVAGFYNGTNGFFRNTFTGDRADNMDEAGARLRLVAKPASRLTRFHGRLSVCTSERFPLWTVG